MRASSSIDVDFRGMPQIKSLLAEFDGQKLQNRTRRALRAGIKPMREGLRAAGRGHGFPRTFRKTRTRGHRNPVGVSVAPASPLSTVFEHGAGSHTIAPKHGAFLASGQGEKPFFARGAVHHPGMAPRPIVGPVFAANEGKATDAVATVLFEGLGR